jgi:hypothetical protein
MRTSALAVTAGCGVAKSGDCDDAGSDGLVEDEHPTKSTVTTSTNGKSERTGENGIRDVIVSL